ncbi:FkbM family methyltransferase [Dethiosulfatarculus sandiegensis]|nr:FkbM family methyltransferase [Dethiosulfatarculus sandiegensis]
MTSTQSTPPVIDFPIVETEPFIFRLAMNLVRKKIRGGFRLLTLARQAGLLNKLYRHHLSREVQLLIPLYRPDDALDGIGVEDYESQVVQAFAAFIKNLPGKVTFLDCGANIGIMSAKMCAACPNINRVVAYEPNADVYSLLQKNLANLPVPAQARQAAVGNMQGTGSLKSPPHDPSSHARFVEADPEGDIFVERLDSLDLTPGYSLALKIDVEGHEWEVLEGASKTIENADGFVISMEAHPRHFQRTQRDPSLMLKWLTQLAEVEFQVSEKPDLKVDPEKPFFEQFSQDMVYNIICRSGLAQ